MQLNRGQPDLEGRASEVDQGDLRSVRSNSISATTAALLGAALTVLSGLVGAVITGYFQTSAEQTRADLALDLERLKFETDLILKALETPAQAEAVKRLKFFAKAGLIPRYQKEVLEIAEEDDGAAVPTLTAPMEPITGDLTRLAGPLGRLMLDGHDICSGAMLLKPWLFLTVDYCVKESGKLHDPSKLLVRWRPRSGAQQVDKIVVLSDGLALLTLRGEPPLVGGKYLDLSKARDPRPDEPLYIIHYALGQKVLSRCKASGEPVEDNNFRYRCNTASGSESGIIFSAVDEAPLGLVYRNGVPDTLGFSDEAKRLSGLEPKIASAISPPP